MSKHISKTIISRLLQSASEARRHAYAPYSGFSVGAALLTVSGEIVSGCNVENSSYGATCCAERSALFAAVSAGHREFEALAVVTNDAGVAPCGICRQALCEFNPDLPVILSDASGSFRRTSLSKLLPEPFTSSQLGTASQPVGDGLE